MIVILVWMFLALFGSSQSTLFQCEYSTGSWGTLGTIYRCYAKNAVSITTLDAAQVDDISGTHLAGYNSENVVAFSIIHIQVHYFPRGINKFFTNLKGIEILDTGLKEIHQSDLKVFQKMTNLWLWSNNLEIIEENLFEFNPNLEMIYLANNKISHIDPNVFDKLTNLRSIILSSNTCINMKAENNPTELQNVIKITQTQCKNSDFSILEQKVKNLQTDSKNLNSENFKIKLEILENEIKNSKFQNFFQEDFKDLKAALVEKKKLEFLDAISTIVKNNSIEMCSALELKVDAGNDKLVVQDLKISRIEEKMTKISNSIELINKNYEDMNKRFKNLMKALENAFSAAQ